MSSYVTHNGNAGPADIMTGEEKDDANPDQDEQLINKSEDGTEKEEEVRYIRKPSRLIVVEPVLLLHALCSMPIGTLGSQYIYQMISDQMNFTTPNDNSSSSCTNLTGPNYDLMEEVQKTSSNFKMYLSIASSVPTLFMTLLLGAYSDQAGRRYAIILPLLGSFVYSAIYVSVIYFNLPLWVLLIASFLEGLGGSIETLLVGFFSYIADVTTNKQRSFRIIVIELLVRLTGAVGPLGFNYWLKKSGYLYPFIFSLGGHLICLLYAICFIPETIITNRRVSFFSCRRLLSIINLYYKETVPPRRLKLCLLMMAFTVVMFGRMNSGILTLFEMNEPLCWGSIMIGWYETSYSLVSSIGGIASARALRYCISDEILALLAGLFDVGKLVYRTFVRNSLMMFMGKYPYILRLDHF